MEEAGAALPTQPDAMPDDEQQQQPPAAAQSAEAVVEEAGAALPTEPDAAGAALPKEPEAAGAALPMKLEAAGEALEQELREQPVAEPVAEPLAEPAEAWPVLCQGCGTTMLIDLCACVFPATSAAADGGSSGGIQWSWAGADVGAVEGADYTAM